MRNKKGFTLVELVIVIAVIAILAGVMIGTFASVVKKAKESAKMQEMTAQKQEQIANDIDQKLKNAEWLGWTDFEEKLADVMADTFKQAKIDGNNVKEAVNDAVEKAFAKYASSIGTSNTGLTADQVKYIVETALSNKSYSGVTAEQVKAIVNNAVSGTSTLTKAQVQAIVDAAAAKNLTLAQVTAAITEATKDLAKTDKVENKFSEIEKNLTASIKNLKDSTLTASDIEALLAKYISNGKVSGNYDWYNANATTMEITGEKTADQLVALSTLAKGGTSFKGKTIELPTNVDLTETDFQPIMDFDGTLKGATKTENNKTVPATTVKVNVTPVWNTLDGRNGKTMMNYLKTDVENLRKDAVGYGFVASLVDGGVVENVNVVLAVDNTANNPGNRYTYFGGIVGFLDGGTIRNCTVSGSITAYNRVGGVVGYAKSGTIEGVIVKDLTITSMKSEKDTAAWSTAGGLIGYASAGTVAITNCTVSGLKSTTADSGTLKGNIVGQLDTWKNAKNGVSNYSEWDATGAKTLLVLTNVTVGNKVLEDDKDKTEENFGSFLSNGFATRITIKYLKLYNHIKKRTRKGAFFTVCF